MAILKENMKPGMIASNRLDSACRSMAQQAFCAGRSKCHCRTALEGSALRLTGSRIHSKDSHVTLRSLPVSALATRAEISQPSGGYGRGLLGASIAEVQSTISELESPRTLILRLLVERLRRSQIVSCARTSDTAVRCFNTCVTAAVFYTRLRLQYLVCNSRQSSTAYLYPGRGRGES